jgi:hypothetical protein
VPNFRLLLPTSTPHLIFFQLIFVAILGLSRESPDIDSFSVPLTSLFTTKFHQPLWGGNYLELEIIPSPEGGLTHGTKAEIRLKDTGLFHFASALDKTRERAVEARRNHNLEEGEGLRMFFHHLLCCQEQLMLAARLIQPSIHLRLPYPLVRPPRPEVECNKMGLQLTKSSGRLRYPCISLL